MFQCIAISTNWEGYTITTIGMSPCFLFMDFHEILGGNVGITVFCDAHIRPIYNSVWIRKMSSKRVQV